MAARNVELANAYINIVPSTRDIAPAIKDALGDVDKAVGKAGRSMGDRISATMGKTMKIGAAATGAAVGGVLAGSIAKGMGRLTSIDRSKQMLKGLGNEAKDVSAIMDNALASVEGTAFGMGEAATVASQMVASGIKPGEELTQVLKTVGDVASITGDSMEGMGMIFGSVKARGKLMGDDLMQLRARGLPVLDILGESLGKTAEEVQEMASQGEISFDIFETAMREKMGGAALAMGDTFQGAVANVGAAMGRLGETILTPVFEASPKILQATRQVFNDMNDAIKPAMEEVGKSLTPALEQAANVVEEKVSPALAEGVGEVAKFLANMVQKGIDSGLWDRIGDSFQKLGDTFKQMWPDLQRLGTSLGSLAGNISVATWEALVNVFNALAPLITSVLVPLIEKVAKFAEENPKTVQALVTAFVGFKAVGAIAGPVKTATGSIKNLTEAASFFSKAFKGGKGLAGGLTTIMSKGFKNANPLIAGASKGIGKFVQILSKMTMVIRPVFNILKLVITKVNPWVAAVTTAIAVLTWFFRKTETGQKVWRALVDGLRTGIDVLKEKFAPLGEWFKGLWDGIIGVIQTAGSVISTVFGWIIEAGKFLVTVIGTAVIAPLILAWNLLSTAIQAAWEYVIKPVWDAISLAAMWLWQNVLVPAFDGIVAAFQKVGDGFQWVWDNIIKPLWDGMVLMANFLWQNALLPVFNLIKAGFEALGTGLRWIYDNIIQPVWDSFANALRWLYDNVVMPVTEWIKNRWQTMGDQLGAIKNWIVDNVFGGLKRGLDTLKGWFGKAVEGITSIWGKIRAATAKPAKFVVETVYNNGIRKAWNLVAGFTGQKKLDPAPLNELGGYAKGGILPGYTPGRDIYNMIDPRTGTRVALSGGEAIMRPEFTRVVGAKSIEALNHAARTGGKAAVARMLGEGAQFAFKKGGVYPNGDTKKKEDQSAGILRADAFMKREQGKPYQWGGVGNPSWDCSGLWSGIVHVINGRNGRSGRLFNTNSFEANPGRFGFVRGLSGPVTIGVMDGHMAGTLSGQNAESRGGDGVIYGPRAWGSTRFPRGYTMASVLGEFLPGGDGGGGGFFDVMGHVKSLWDSVIDKIPKFDGPGLIGKMPGAMLKKIAENAWNFLKEKVGAFAGSMGQAGNAESWREMAMAAMRRNGFNADDPRQVNAMLSQIMSESGGIPDRAQEIVDINGTGASAGLGLLQIIPGTFADHRDPTLPNDRTDPWANMNAALRYYRSRYGTDLTTQWGHGHGYAAGGVLPGYTPGRDVHHFFSPTAGNLHLSGGEAIMVPEWTKAVGGPVAVARMNKAARSGRGITGGTGYADGGVVTPRERFWQPIGERRNRVATELNTNLRALTNELIKTRNWTGFTNGVTAAIQPALRELEKIADPNTYEGIAARSMALNLGDIFGDIGFSSINTITNSLVTAERELLDSRAQHVARIDDIKEKEKALEEAREKAATLKKEAPEVSIKDQRRLEDAEAALEKARKQSTAATEASTKSEENKTKAQDKANDKVADAEKKLARVREDIGIKEGETAEKRAEDIKAADEAVTKAEQDLATARKKSAEELDMLIYDSQPGIFHGLKRAIGEVQKAANQATTAMPQAAGAINAVKNPVVGFLERLAAAAGPAGMSVGELVRAIKTFIKVAKTLLDTIDKLVQETIKARATAWNTIAETFVGMGQWADTVKDFRQQVALLTLDQAKAQMDLADAYRDVRIVAMNGIKAQLKGIATLAEAQISFDESLKADVKAAQANYEGLSLAFDRFRHQAFSTFEDTMNAQIMWSDKTWSLWWELQSTRTDMLLLEKQAQIDLLGAQHKAVLAGLDLVQVTNSLGIAAKKLAIASGKAFGMDEVEATVGERWAKLQAEKAELKAGNASYKTWLNPVNWFTSMPASNRRIKQIDEELARLEKRDEFTLSTAVVEEANKLVKQAGAMGFFGSGDKVADMVKHSALGDASRTLDAMKFETELLDIKAKQTEYEDKINRSEEELRYRRAVTPVELQKQALEQQQGAQQTWSEYYKTENQEVRDALAKLANYQEMSAKEFREMAKNPNQVVYMDPTKTAYSADEVARTLDQLGVRVGKLENPPVNGAAVAMSRR